MVFSSIVFLFAFLPTVLFFYFALALNRAAKNYVLLIFSLLFYAWGGFNLIPLILYSIATNYFFGRMVTHAATKKVWMIVAVASNIGMLFYFKYVSFLTENLHQLLPTFPLIDIALPIGISFYTFQTMSYTIDVYKRRCKVETNPLHYALFVSFFPTLITGPIERYPQMRPQIKKSRRFSYNRCAGGAFRMLWGYTKKMVIADNLSQYVSFVYGNMSEMSGPNLAAATVLFAVQLYMDFSGCCDIVLGAARILGYDLIENFDSPFEARSFNDFWRRWHISMTGWFRDYVYFSLGGSRCAPWRHYLNIVVVFLCSGLWHGADWRYLAWGLACGILAAFGAMTAKARKRMEKFNPLYQQAWLKTVCQVTITNLLFCFTLVFFAAALYNADPFAIYGAMLQGWNGLAGSWHQVQQLLLDSGIDGRLPVVLLFGTFVVFAVEHDGRSVARWIREQVWPLRWTLYYAAAAAILFFAAFGQSAFIYQQY